MLTLLLGLVRCDGEAPLGIGKILVRKWNKKVTTFSNMNAARPFILKTLNYLDNPNMILDMITLTNRTSKSYNKMECKDYSKDQINKQLIITYIMLATKVHENKTVTVSTVRLTSDCLIQSYSTTTKQWRFLDIPALGIKTGLNTKTSRVPRPLKIEEQYHVFDLLTEAALKQYNECSTYVKQIF